MKVYTAAIPNKACQAIIDRTYPKMRFMLSPASQTGFRDKRLKLLYERGYAIDNGAYSYYTKGQDFNGGEFLSLCDKYADRADWIVIPDKVGDWVETCKMAMRWINILLSYDRPLMMVAQDGAEENDFETLRSWTRNSIVSGGIFVGGTTDWKLKNMKKIADICKEANKICHVGRVNSKKRIELCWHAGVSSVDGSGASRFNPTALIISRAILQLERQHTLF